MKDNIWMEIFKEQDKSKYGLALLEEYSKLLDPYYKYSRELWVLTNIPFF